MRVDEELRELFAQEAQVRLARLAQQLLELEESGSDPELIASIFRDAHTIKGSAAVVGLDEVTAIAHVMEEVLDEVRNGTRRPDRDLVSAMLTAVDGLVEIVAALVDDGDWSDLAAVVEAGLHAALAANPATGDVGAVASVGVVPAQTVRADAETVMVPVSRLDELVRLVGESASAQLRMGRLLANELGVEPASTTEYRELSLVLNDLQERTMRARMVPVATITSQLHRAVRDLSHSLGKDVRWDVRGEDTELDRGVLQQLSDPLLHLVRNAVDHGIEGPAEREAAGKPEQATIRLHAMQIGSEVIIVVSDDGRGISVENVRARAAQAGNDTAHLSDEEALYLIFTSGFSTAKFVTDISGRGVGLDVVRSGIEAVRGRVEVHSEPGVGCEFRIVVPITLAVLPCLLVAAGGQSFAIPMHSVVLALSADNATAHAEGRPLVWVNDTAVPITDLAAALGTGTARWPTDNGAIVVLAGVTRRHAFRVDALLGQRDVVVKGLSRLLPRLDVLAGASVEPDGSILAVLDAPGLIERARVALPGLPQRVDVSTEVAPRRASVLVVDDALTVRELERSILERAGYQVRVAADGIEALACLAEGPSDVVLTDIEMPRMDGFALTEAIRNHPSLANVAVLILTSRASETDRQRGLDVGADGYIVKSAFDEAALLSAVDRVLGRAA